MAALPSSATAGARSRRGGTITIPAAAKAMDCRTKSLRCLWKSTTPPLLMRQPWPLRDNDNRFDVDDNVDVGAESEEDPARGDRARPVNCSVAWARNYPSTARLNPLTVFIPAAVDVHSRPLISIKTISNMLCNFSYQFAIFISVCNFHICLQFSCFNV